MEKKHETVACAYNGNHMIRPEKLVWHYVKCEDRKRLQNLFRVCPYNSTHHVPVHEIDAHIQKCKPNEPEMKLTFSEDDPWA